MSSSTPNVRYLNLSVNDEDARAKLHAVLESVMCSGRVVNNDFITDFEKVVQSDSERRHSVAVGSGTGALWMALRLAGVGPGDEVITSALGWLGSVNPIYLCGATARFVDIGEDLNMRVSAVEEAVTPKTKAILAVHYTGLPCDMEALMNLSRVHNIPVIEDCAQAYGAQLNGKPVGSYGELAAFSMNPMKLFAAIGEAGAVVFDRNEWLSRAHSLRHNGLHQLEYCLEPSLNDKPDSLQCGFLVARRPMLHEVLRIRKRNSEIYNRELANCVRLPDCPAGRVFYMYTIQADRRDGLQAYLANHGIESKVRHPILLNEQSAYASGQNQRASSFVTPLASRIKNAILSLPIHEKLGEKDIVYVCDTLKKFYAK